MKTLFEHIEHVKGKPHHIRKRVAFALAAGGTGVVAVVWLVGSVSLGTFALPNTSFADSTGQSPVLSSDGAGGNSNLAGAAAALSNENTPARIEIIDAASPTSGQKKAEQTVIPF